MSKTRLTVWAPTQELELPAPVMVLSFADGAVTAELVPDDLAPAVKRWCDSGLVERPKVFTLGDLAAAAPRRTRVDDPEFPGRLGAYLRRHYNMPYQLEADAPTG